MFDDCHCHFTRLHTLRRAHTTQNLFVCVCVYGVLLFVLLLCVPKAARIILAVLWIIWSKNNTDYSLCCYLLLLFDVVVVCLLCPFWFFFVHSLQSLRLCDMYIRWIIRNSFGLSPAFFCQAYLHLPKRYELRTELRRIWCVLEMVRWVSRYTFRWFVAINCQVAQHSSSSCRSCSRRNFIFMKTKIQWK